MYDVQEQLQRDDMLSIDFDVARVWNLHISILVEVYVRFK